jgi:hypothetical protein
MKSLCEPFPSFSVLRVAALALVSTAGGLASHAPADPVVVEEAGRTPWIPC